MSLDFVKLRNEIASMHASGYDEQTMKAVIHTEYGEEGVEFFQKCEERKKQAGEQHQQAHVERVVLSQRGKREGKNKHLLDIRSLVAGILALVAIVAVAYFFIREFQKTEQAKQDSFHTVQEQLFGNSGGEDGQP
ncbi:MAG TPA: hypothetical protein P5560_11485 [Thermotogota bacterium]|nr:hypothetical protein [Thermotogota bacterium]HRW93562.1 hypothetical protein [Thermotogota bacterium]